MPIHRTLRILTLALWLGLSIQVQAREERAGASAASGHAGQESRVIKSLSAEEVGSLLAGKGMGFAKAAELNGYPGPAHVLELAKDLDLSGEQRHRTEALFGSMEQHAASLGLALVQAERELDRLFADGSVTADALSAVLTKIGALQFRLRDVHLQAHLEQKRILTPSQTVRYAELRGYASGVQLPRGSSPRHEHRHHQ